MDDAPHASEIRGEGSEIYPHIQATTGTPSDAQPALDFNGYILYASDKAIPKEHFRVVSGTSVAEPGSVYDEESGRLYHNHGTGKYYFPNDPAEQDRLDLQHQVITLLMDHQLHRAPVASPKNVLDIATGTGIWAIKFAKQHPESTVVGTDLSLVQPPAESLPPNVSFVKEDSEKDKWIFPDPFDFIFLRIVCGCFDNHRVVVQKSFDNLNPGGWIEFNDWDVSLLSTDGTASGTAHERWTGLMGQAMAGMGRDFFKAKTYKQTLIDAGFVDVVEEIIPAPVNGWPSDPKFHDIGRWNMLNITRGLRGVSWKLLRNLGMEHEEVEQLVQQVKADVMNTSIHSFVAFYIVYGRKPYPGESGDGRAA